MRGEILSPYVIGVFPSNQHPAKDMAVLADFDNNKLGATISIFETGAIVLFNIR